MKINLLPSELKLVKQELRENELESEAIPKGLTQGVKKFMCSD